MTGRVFLLLAATTMVFGCYNRPRSYDGGESYPSPLSPITNIEVSVASSHGQPVTMEVYDVRGVQMGRTSLGVIDTTTTFRIEDLWKVATDSLGSTDSTLVHVLNFDAGVYFYRLKSNDSTFATQKFVLLK